MEIRFHPHALDRMIERGCSREEAVVSVQNGEQFSAKFGRTGFRRNFIFDGKWRGKPYSTKQVEAYAVAEKNDWLIITVVTRYF